MSSSGTAPLPQLDSQDNEAAGLLMLFSTQSQKRTPTNTVPSGTTVPSRVPDEVQLNDSIHTEYPNETSAVAEPTRTSSSSSNTSNRHRRESSQSQSQAHRIDTITRSPGPAAAALASGNGSNKAIVAAAALAAAAATPLPVMHKAESSFPNEAPPSIDAQLQDQIDMNQEEAPAASYIVVKDEKRPKRSTEKKEERSTSKRREERGRDTKPRPRSDTRKASPPPYAVGPDAGIISCVCGYDHDDGLTIQCDKCFRWQHLICMGFKSIDDTPDDFQCNLCNKNLHVDEQRAKQLQESYLKEERSKRKRSPYVSDSNKDTGKNVGAPQFKKKKIEEQNMEVSGVNKYRTLYFPIDYFVFKSSQIKALFNQLPDLLKKDNSVVKVERLNLNRLVINSQNLNLRNPAESSKVKFTGISKLGLYSAKPIREGSCISLLYGEVDTKQNYITEKVNKYWLLGCPKPHVYFHPNLPIAVDQRGLGNFSRFIRKACKPNCEIRTLLINKNEIGFAVFTTIDIKADQELTLPWEWDDGHPILRMINEDITFDQFEIKEKMTIINSVLSILDLTDCACSSTCASDCVISKIKKSSAYLQRNTRKNAISQITTTPNQKHIPIEQRLKERQVHIVNGITHASSYRNTETNSKITNDLMNMNDGRSDSTHSMAFTETDTIKDQRDIDENADYVFKPKIKNSYSIHVLPKQFELIKKYSKIITPVTTIPAHVATPRLENAADGEITEETLNKELPIPIEINPTFMQKLNKTVSSDTIAASSSAEPGANVTTGYVEDRPKIKKKFSLADYKKKKTA
jgi:hypothetical protein